MLEVSFKIKGVTPIIYGKVAESKKEKGEGAEAYDLRVAMERAYINADGIPYFPGAALKNMLTEAAKFRSETVPGKGKATFTKHFEAGIICPEPIITNKTKADIKIVPFFVPADGKKGGTTRVFRNFPRLPQDYEATGKLYVIDTVLTERIEKVKEYLEEAGKFIGLMTFRPRRGGEYGRFQVVEFSYKEI